ncbi:glutamine ABC transporter substrate-binding protein [Oceanobacillus bengalensis]|uniref:Glutamine ABC transporter substrate-binding protein n=1 Tax=Oceanobacillus bengalensis TaxID=1435466 RepID=A0A494Z7Q9_9BACI|nr:glutamine ABC transporter substrate-binding protein [Oceanobacillus bengalensis]RKQ18642.1 glutamine ABC transporter substrate-binding protein [Oceanobacillus bengalensis]
MKNRKLQFGFIVFSLAFILLLAACGGNTEETSGGGGSTDDETTASEGTTDEEANSNENSLNDSYTIVSDNSFVPFEFVEDGELVGFDIELIKAIAEEAGFEITNGEIETTNFDGIIPGLQTGQFEIAIAGISITEERAQVIDYSDPYYESGLAIGVQSDNEEINGLEDLEGKTIATRLGSTSSAFIKENIEGAEPNEYEQLDQAYLAVENGSADAILYDAPNVKYYIATTGAGKLKVVGDLYQAEDYGIAITKGNEELVEAINDALATLRENGTYDEIYNKWFGSQN